MSNVISPPTKPEMSQKDYLKKYLSKGEKKKKKKVIKISSSSHIKRSVIIDDDLGLPSIASVDDEEFNFDHLGEEAPQIAGVIDERPPEIRAKESHGDENRWKPVGESGDAEREKIVEENVILLDSENELDPSKHLNGENSSRKRRSISHGDSDLSPRRNNTDHRSKSTKKGDLDLSPPRTKNKYERKENKSVKIRYPSDEDSDLSPPRSKSKRFETKHSNRGERNNRSPIRSNDRHRQRNLYSKNGRKEIDSDHSPPRKNKYEHRSKRNGNDSNHSPPRNIKKNDRMKRKGSDSDLSPPRKNSDRGPRRERTSKRNDSDSDLSPPRKNINREQRREIRKRNDSDSDLSPRRKNRNREQWKEKTKRNDSDSDLSPPRKNKDREQRYDRTKRKDIDSDLSPPRKNRGRENRGERAKRKGSDSDLSPPRKNNKIGRVNRKGSDSDLSPPRKNKPHMTEKSLDKTLDGKKAGLQNARNLKEELRKLKEQENAMFEKMQAGVSGKSAAPVMRDRKTGKIRDLNHEAEVKQKISAKVAERENKYAKWGKGLKQIEQAQDKVTDYLHEINKPLARYANDQDLENLLKSREREGDPMLDYIKSKQSESIDVDVPAKPSYKGYYLPNRFNIRPGHRWDGVDRSSGYEKQWFERQNSQKALQEEAYKWSTSDM